MYWSSTSKCQEALDSARRLEQTMMYSERIVKAIEGI